MTAIARPMCVALALCSACADGEEGRDTCFGVCGPGTRCDAQQCVIAQAAEDPAAVTEAKSPRKSRRRRADAGASPAGGATGYQPVDDRAIPRYDPNATVTLDPNAGGERLDDGEVRASLRGLEPAFNRCIAEAVAGGVDVGTGEVQFELGVAASGKITGVNARAPGPLRDAGVDACLRKAIYSHRFPSYDGPAMGVTYSFEYG